MKTQNLLKNIMLSTIAIAVAQTIPIVSNAAIAAPRLVGQVASSPTMVHVAGQDVFSINADAGGFTAAERTLIVERNINNALKSSRDTSPNTVQVIRINNIPVVRIGGFHVITADSSSASVARLSMDELAANWANGIRQALADQPAVTAYINGLGGDFLPSSEFVPYRRARLEAARLNHAAPAFRENVSVDLITSDSLTVDGLNALEDRKPEVAMQCFTKAIDINQGNSRAHFGLGSALLQQGKVKQSIVELQMARWLEPDYAGVHIALGQAFESQGEARDAVKQYQEAALLQRDNPEPVLAIADIREGRNDIGKSVQELSLASQRIPTSEYIMLKEKDQRAWRLNRAF
jgi:tetratricopeptide (TPR) repeat protein